MLCGHEPATNRFGPRVVNTIDIQEAFRLGIRGEAMVPRGGVGLAEGGAAPYAAGANEAVLLQLSRLPGLREPRAAYETGRALRMIIRLFDQAGAPERIGRQFIDNLAGAVVVEHLRNRGRPWGATETVAIGSVKWKRVSLNGVLSAQMRPPCASTMPRAIARPRPAPPVARERDFSPR